MGAFAVCGNDADANRYREARRLTNVPAWDATSGSDRALAALLPRAQRSLPVSFGRQ